MTGSVAFANSKQILVRRRSLLLMSGLGFCLSGRRSAFAAGFHDAEGIAIIAESEAKSFDGLSTWAASVEDRVARYCADLAYTPDSLRFHFSAIFISWCVRQAGFSCHEFRTAARHIDYIRDGARGREGCAFEAFPFDATRPARGDIISFSRAGMVTFDHVVRSDAPVALESAVCLDVGPHRLQCAIANWPNGTIGYHSIALTELGYIQHRDRYPFLSILRLRS